ncbi:GNAT family protein [Virgibacillus siamensis]|uniref:GNAT family protein n=1 Tax=Virgibacillus siamensis TaxID=480071 RepID=A0ABP3R6B1_9BACI
MTYEFKKITQKQAEDIAYNWHYEDKYSFYDMEADKEDLEEFLDPEARCDSSFAVMSDNELIGFFSADKKSDGSVDIGLGMRPDLTGKGKGREFLKAGMDFVRSKYDPINITLAVATFNQRAIKVYRRLGFDDAGTFMQDTNGDRYEFLKMVYEC